MEGVDGLASAVVTNGHRPTQRSPGPLPSTSTTSTSWSSSPPSTEPECSPISCTTSGGRLSGESVSGLAPSGCGDGGPAGPGSVSIACSLHNGSVLESRRRGGEVHDEREVCHVVRLGRGRRRRTCCRRRTKKPTSMSAERLHTTMAAAKMMSHTSNSTPAGGEHGGGGVAGGARRSMRAGTLILSTVALSADEADAGVSVSSFVRNASSAPGSSPSIVALTTTEAAMALTTTRDASIARNRAKVAAKWAPSNESRVSSSVSTDVSR
mmetsp:Transcript_20677/g.63239  ORF Transcript_20677/g.63239 Transcript_20677/m.63239 type:complete len:267 (+) Transcript_20677:569-1369(+)|eukprot:scaffold171852_cov27-Tisochrysis_lutea.AAC.2